MLAMQRDRKHKSGRLEVPRKPKLPAEVPHPDTVT